VTSNHYLGWSFWKRERDCTAAASSASHQKILQLLPSKQKLNAKCSTYQDFKLRHYPLNVTFGALRLCSRRR
jgi:hypothetical protein